MPVFRYRAVGGGGEVLEGEMEAASRGAVIDRLRNQGFLPIQAREHAARQPAAWLQRRLGRRRPPGREAVELMLRELAILLRAGLALDQALEVMVRHTENAATGALIQSLADRVRGGMSLGDAMARAAGPFDRFCIGMVRAGEAGGTLDAVLTRIADFMERARKFRSEAQAALRYPLILLVFALASIAVIVTVVIPSFEDIFTDAGFELPLATRVVMAIGSLSRRFWWIPLLAGSGAFLLLAHALRRPAFRLAWDRRRLGLPLFGRLWAKAETVRLCYTLGMLINNGVPLVHALPVVRETLGNAAMVAALADVEQQLKEGRSFADLLLRSGLFPAMGMQLLRIGEETGRLEDMLFRVADAYEHEVQRSTQRLLTLLVPILTCVMALLIGGIIASILLPMLSIPQLVL
jgi:general secretion pathway protein F